MISSSAPQADAEKATSSSIRDNETDGSATCDEKGDTSVADTKEKEVDIKSTKPRHEDSDLEIQDASDDDSEQRGEIRRVSTPASVVTVQTHQSVFSRLSRIRSRPKNAMTEVVVLPVMDLENGVIGWESQDDPEMPLNFSSFHKWLGVGLLSAISFTTPFASSILAPAISFIAEDFGMTNLTLASMPVSIFLLGYALGPLVLSPLSEIYGRHIVLMSATAWFCVWLIGCALAPEIGSLIFFRLMSGIGGSGCQTIGGAIIADMFPVSQRGGAMTIWMLGPMVGPSAAPLIAGFVCESIGWRWVNWIVFIPATLTLVAMCCFNRETNHQVIIMKKTVRLRKELGRPELRSCYVNPEAPVLTQGEILINGLVRPAKMLFTSAIVFSASLYIAFAYGCLYLLFNTIPMVFREGYGWSAGITGLVYLTLLVGFAIGLSSFYLFSDSTVIRMTEANGGVFKPEFRLPNCLYFSFLLPVTFFWYGWSADQRVHWIVPVVGIVPFGAGIVGVWLPLQAYLVDAFPQYAASVLAAFAVLRSTVAAFLPLAGTSMYESLGIGWGTSLLGFIAVALIPIPTLIYRYGERMRKRFPIKL